MRFQLSQQAGGSWSNGAGQPPSASNGKRRRAAAAAPALAVPPMYNFGSQGGASNDNTDEVGDFEVLSGGAGGA